jgi:hypothetical protein
VLRKSWKHKKNSWSYHNYVAKPTKGKLRILASRAHVLTVSAKAILRKKGDVRGQVSPLPKNVDYALG